MSEEQAVERRLNRIEDAIERLTEISANLNKMVAVHNEKFSQQERQLNFLEETLERRREESDVKLRDVYNTIRSEDQNIVSCINDLRQENNDQYLELSRKISNMEKSIWMYMGGFSVIAFLLAYGPGIIKLFIQAQ